MTKLTEKTPGISDYRRGDPVGLFVPCYVDLVYPQVADATRQLLQKFDVTIVEASQQSCCGQPAFNSGYWHEAECVVRKFCELFKDQLWIVTPSGSCAAMCRNHFAKLGDEFAGVGYRVFELCEFLVDGLGITKTGSTFPHKAALHIGCHTRREINAAAASQTLLENVRDIELRKIPDAEECCGFGGTFSVRFPELSVAMGKTKIKNVLACGADVLVSPDASCLMHLDGLIEKNREARHVKTVHIAEVLVAGIADG